MDYIPSRLTWGYFIKGEFFCLDKASKCTKRYTGNPQLSFKRPS